MEDFDALLREHGDGLYRLCLLYLRDTHLAMDAVQDTFLRAFRAWDGYRGESSPKTWLTAIAVNVCRDYLRSSWFRRVDLVLENIPAPPAADPEDDALLRRIMELPPKYREVILLYYYQELTVPEIAELLRVNPNTVSTRLRRAREKLRPKLKGWWDDEPCKDSR